MEDFYIKRVRDGKYAKIRRNICSGERYIEYVSDKGEARLFNDTLYNMAIRDKLFGRTKIEKVLK